jgi:hypothetical protein
MNRLVCHTGATLPDHFLVSEVNDRPECACSQPGTLALLRDSSMPIFASSLRIRGAPRLGRSSWAAIPSPRAERFCLLRTRVGAAREDHAPARCLTRQFQYGPNKHRRSESPRRRTPSTRWPSPGKSYCFSPERALDLVLVESGNDGGSGALGAAAAQGVRWCSVTRSRVRTRGLSLPETGPQRNRRRSSRLAVNALGHVQPALVPTRGWPMLLKTQVPTGTNPAPVDLPPIERVARILHPEKFRLLSIVIAFVPSIMLPPLAAG